MKKRGYHIFFAALCGLCFIGVLALWALKQNGIYLWLGGIATPHLSFFLTGVMILLIPIWLCVSLWHRISSKVARAFLCVGLMMLLLPVLWAQAFGYAWNYGAETYTTYTSQDGAHTVVVMDATYFQSVYGDVYEMTSPITMRKLGVFHGEAGSRYIVYWEEDYVIIEYGGKTTRCELLED